MKRYVLIYIESTWHFLNVDDYTDYTHSPPHPNHLFITAQTSDLVRYLTAEYPNRKLPNIVDLESLDKQMSQEGKDIRIFDDWSLLSSLRHHKIIDSEFELCHIQSFLECVAKLFTHLYDKDEEEVKRFESVEQTINNILFKRQALGIRIDSEIAKNRCRILEKEIYSIKNSLQLDYSIYTPDNQKLQLCYLKSKGYNIIHTPLYTFKIRRNEDPICQLFYQLIRNKQDLDSLLYILAHWGGAERTHPSFLGFGTITSRIILRQPALQNLRKTNRDIIISDKGMKLLYPDYSQFEAGILASLSDDDELINLYNTDIYTDIADKVLNDRDRREEAKIIFYRYMYGDTTLDDQSNTYFKKFKKLQEYIKTVQQKLLSDLRIGTTNGNFRHIKEEEETSWSLSHAVQSFASLIYKNAIIRVQVDIPTVEFLIPMHDATLYQVNRNSYEECKEKIKHIYIDEFKKLCPKIEPRVNFDEFFANNQL